MIRKEKMKNNYISLSEIESKPIPRASTGLLELDWLYGYSKYQDNTVWGLPKGKISLWNGESGVGKSRLAIEVAKEFCKRKDSHKVLFILTEADLKDFAGWIKKDSSNYKNFFCSGESGIEEIIKIIYELQPHLVFIDSINEIDEFESGNKKEARLIINGEDEMGGLRKVCNDVGCHIVLLGQLNQNGTIKGGTSLPHLVDIVFDLIKDSTQNKFIVSVGIKHRYGRKGKEFLSTWFHTETGVECYSANRVLDKEWMSSHRNVTPKNDSFIDKKMTQEEEDEFLRNVDELLEEGNKNSFTSNSEDKGDLESFGVVQENFGAIGQRNESWEDIKKETYKQTQYFLNQCKNLNTIKEVKKIDPETIKTIKKENIWNKERPFPFFLKFLSKKS